MTFGLNPSNSCCSKCRNNIFSNGRNYCKFNIYLSRSIESNDEGFYYLISLLPTEDKVYCVDFEELSLDSVTEVIENAYKFD